MATLVFRLRNVPEDEAQAVRTLLDTNNIDWYETTAGNWGIAMPGIWINNSDEVGRARSLIDAYQIERRNALQLAYKDEKLSGENRTFIQSFKDSPLQVVAIILFCLFIVYVSINPFLQLIGYSAQ